MMKGKPAIWLILFLLSSTGPGPMVLGCNVPVFRYALERWVPSEYILEVYQDSPFTEPEKKLIKNLNNLAVSGGGFLNIEININNTDAAHYDQELLSRLPGMVLYFPDDTSHSNPIWAGGLLEENVKKLVDSPARRKIKEELRNDRTAVFLILSSSRGESDQERNRFAEKILSQAEKEIYITAPGTDIHGNPIKNPDFSHTELSFTSIFVDRMNPEEEILARILLGTERDLWDYDVPIAFPLFGRGRILYALVGDGINKSMLFKACSAVTGWCSCIVKDDNPGTDLLLAADWNSGLGDSWIEPEELPELEGISSFAGPDVADDPQVAEFFSSEAPEPDQIIPETPLPEKKTASTGTFFILLMASLFISIVVLSMIIFRKRDK